MTTDLREAVTRALFKARFRSSFYEQIARIDALLTAAQEQSDD